jgi:hypothetical protein
MCVNCGNSSCHDCNGVVCPKPTELKYTSQIVYDGELIDLTDTIGLKIEPCENLNDIIKKIAEKMNELYP